MNILKIIPLFFSLFISAQAIFTIKGNLNNISNHKILLKGYHFDTEKLLAENETDSGGNFTIKYPADYVGAAILEISDDKKIIILLNHENFEIYWGNLSDNSSLKFINSPENSSFDKGLELYQSAEGKKAGLEYLLPYYKNDDTKYKIFEDELAYVKNTTSNFLLSLNEKSYARYYLQQRILLTDFQLSAQKSYAGLAELEARFKSLNLADSRLYNSGLYKELVDNYIIGVENYGNQSPSKINYVIDHILHDSQLQPDKKQSILTYIFKLLEKRSLYVSSEYLAQSILNDSSLQLDERNKALFEQYRKMAVGNVVSDIYFVNSKSPIKKLSDLKNQYKLIIFGASWCPKCVEEIPQFKKYYGQWRKNYNLEIVFVSIDTDLSAFSNFTKDFPWISSSDLKGWDSKDALNYSVFATPTMYLVTKNNEILLKPTSAEQIEAWLLIQ